MNIFLQVVLPIVFIFFTGYMVQKWKPMNLKSISTLVVYITSPFLVFRTFYSSEFDMQYLLMAVFALLLFFILVLFNKLYAKIRGYSTSVENGMVLAIGFMNSGNYGAPILLFAYGEAAFHIGVSLMVLHAVMMNFLGGYYANSSGGIKKALLAVAKLPSIYAAALALIFQFAGLHISGNFYAAIEMVADSAIPLVMLVLGMQLAEIKLKVFDWGKVVYGTVARLLVSPLIAFGLVLLMPFDPVMQKVLIVTSAMPTAAMAAIYAVQFDAESELVSSITFISTIASIFTVTGLLYILG